tara:strand:- start:1607 stop:1780 length:174 start_codon:yes stop_codon:yes gene_type:complete
MVENLKIKFDKVYVDDRHIATIRFGNLTLLVRLSKDISEPLNYVSKKLNLKIVKLKK